MVKHIVFWALKEQAEGNTKEQNAQLIKKKLENLVGIVPQIQTLSVGINENGGEYDICLICEFETIEDLKQYDINPAHEQVKGFVKKVVEKRAAVDFTA